ncbi:protein GRIP-like isoform X1 [Actinidia eriantha]|uniref:protein GRIP-like isoform X1 n=2 Tax=Actinidia eriantha TaxID=165200 RepID=UPI002586C2F9|nr:protein GRIP-like isoform X1 [Actinidia eriantha]XP_057469350.1 protein GRIP-like isoform X1 [Actinidia eriantha]XP_057469351.1 protein GRIP-like isoform X1 [Actinidia eriantha]
MSKEGVDVGGMLENHAEDGVKPDDQLIDTNHGSGENLGKENGLHGHPYTSDSNLVQMVVELNFQNEYLKSQFEDLRNLHSESSGSSQQKVAIEEDGGGFEDVKELRAKIESLSRELSEEKQTRGAAEEALKHLRAVYSEADVKAQELSTKLSEAQQKMDQEIKERDEKYSELDSKFNRLHKRAKQRIQEVQKEKDDLEAQFRDLKEKADHALSQQSALQQDLERTRQQANDALKAMDVDRQQLRSANNKLRDNIEELRRSLEPKENALEALQQSLLEKAQMLEDMQGLLQAADDKRQAAITELSAKHQKQIESLEAQLSDELADRSKATETISALQGVIAEKESKIAEMDAASSGEVARFRAAMETVKGELIHLKHEHEKEKKSWEATTQALKTKLDFAESSCVHAEIEAAKTRSQLELELSVRGQLISTRDAELKAAKEEINRLETEFSSYKARAHTLLQKKDAELATARDNELLKEHEEALKEAEKEVQLISAERDRALQDLQDALANHINEIGARDEALSSAEQKIKSMQIKLNSADARYQSEKEAWEISLQNLEETWRLRCEALKAQKEVSPSPDLQKELEDLKLLYKKLKEEHDSFRDLADKLIEEKDKEISRLIDDNKNLHKSQELRPLHEQTYSYTAAFQKQDAAYSSTSATEQQILTLARQQAQREEELAQSQRHILALQEEIEELERENRLHSQQEAMLKEEFRNMERSKKREGVDMTYLKNVILKLLQTGEVEALLPVVAMLLQFSPDEMQKCQQAYRSSTDVPPSPASDTSGSGFSLFPRFSFS